MDFDFSNIINAVSEFFTEDPLGRVASVVTIATAIISFIIWIINIIIKIIRDKTWRKNEISKLSEIADNEKIELIKSKKYIPTMGQFEPPHDGETILISSNRFSLLNMLLDEFISKSFEKKRYIVMGGSGMGKSTFLAALFYKYINKNKLKKSPYPIYIRSLANPEVIDEISNLKDERVNQSILLLDGLDENIHASKDIVGFMEKLESVAHDFRIVVMTCRTQFFKDADSEPKKWSIPVSGASQNRRIQYNAIYISPFSDNEVDRYLKAKYGSSTTLYKKAKTISNKSFDIISRPMILSFMDDLLDLKDIEHITRIEIYSVIIDKWFNREIEFNNSVKKSDLLSFSKELAVYMYDQWRASNTLFLSGFQYDLFINNHGYKKDLYSYDARSLVNRTSKGDRKFSHRSFWEFFLALDSFECPGKQYMAKGLEMAKKFHEDLYRLYQTGKHLPFIDTFDFHYSLEKGDFQDDAVKNKIKQIKTIYSQYPHNVQIDDPENLFVLVYQLYELFLQRLRNQYGCLDDDFKINVAEERDMNMQKIHHYKMYPYFINRIFAKFLDFFEKPYDETMTKIRNLISTIEDSINEISTTCKLLSNNINISNENLERYSFPNYVQDVPQETKYVNTIHLGLGFNQIADITTAIEYLYKCLPNPLLIIYIDVRTLNELQEFTSKLSSSFIDKRKIIFRVLFNNTIIDYVNEWNNQEDFVSWNRKCNKTGRTLNIIQNIIKAKNYQGSR